VEILRKSLRAQLLLTNLMLVGLMVAGMTGAVIGFFRLGNSIDRILKDNYKSVVAAQNMKEALERMDSSATFFLAGQKVKARAQYKKNRPAFESAYATESDNITEQGEQIIADDINNQFSRYRQDIERLLFSSPSLTIEEARNLYFLTLEPGFVRLKSRAQDILDLNQSAIVRADMRAKSEARRSALMGIMATAIALIAAILLSGQTFRTLVTPLISLTRQATEIGAGRLNQRIELRRADEIGQLAAAFNDMTAKLQEARRIESERLQRAERMSDAALDNLFDPVIVTDASGRVAHLNRAAEALFGEANKAQGRPVQEVVSEPRLTAAIERAIHGETEVADEGDAAFLSLNPALNTGEEHHSHRVFRLRASPMKDDAEHILGAAAVLEDVTRFRELDRLKTEFISVASHELRTPVQSLLLSVQLLQEGAAGALTPEQTEIVAAQRQDLERLQSLMRDLLDVTRLEMDTLPPRREAIPPFELIKVAYDSVAPQAEARGVRFATNVSDELPFVYADRGQIQRALVNLLNNAIRHTSATGDVNLNATASPDREKVIFTVADTGDGIPADYLPHIFERFVQVPGATRGGAGLGLSIVQGIVTAHDGEITVTSEKGKGSAFRLILPAVSDDEESNPTNRKK
jgi:PAS domain S-box-containing protein